MTSWDGRFLNKVAKRMMLAAVFGGAFGLLSAEPGIVSPFENSRPYKANNEIGHAGHENLVQNRGSSRRTCVLMKFLSGACIWM